ncbi:MAG: FIST N-terminal domain-containing protein [Planctomycetota bacterium]
MEFHSALAESSDLEEACDAIASEIRRALGTQPLDLLCVFASASYGSALDRLPVMLHERIAVRTLVGSTALEHGTAEQQQGQGEPQSCPALSVLAGRLDDGAEVAATVVSNGDLPHPDAPPSAWRALLPESSARLGSPLPRDESTDASRDVRGVLVWTEPFHTDIAGLLTGLDYALPVAPKVGGLASGSNHPHGNALFCGRRRTNQGAVLLTFRGAVDVQPVVSQGCRPIGRVGRITEANNNRLVGVDNKPIKSFLTEQLQELGSADLEIAQGSPLFLGIASDPFAVAAPDAGEFLVRNVLGIDQQDHLVVGERLAVGRSVQLHLRDATSGVEDLDQRLRHERAADACAALMFRCIGRNSEDHGRFASLAPDVPLLGGTCNGEIGPVGAVTHLHGYTASCVLLRPASVADGSTPVDTDTSSPNA